MSPGTQPGSVLRVRNKGIPGGGCRAVAATRPSRSPSRFRPSSPRPKKELIARLAEELGEDRPASTGDVYGEAPSLGGLTGICRLFGCATVEGTYGGANAVHRRPQRLDGRNGREGRARRAPSVSPGWRSDSAAHPAAHQGGRAARGARARSAREGALLVFTVVSPEASISRARDDGRAPDRESIDVIVVLIGKLGTFLEREP